MTNPNQKYVLQLCHGYKPPFLDVARQYASLFKNTPYHLVTVYLTGSKNSTVIKATTSDTVLFLENQSKDLRGLKRKQIRQVAEICNQYSFEFAIGHRYKSLFILCQLHLFPVFAVHHAFGVYHRFMRRWYVNHHIENLFLLGVSNAISTDIQKYLPHFPKAQIKTLYNRIDSSQVQSLQVNKIEARDHLGLPQDCFIFANVGRLHPDKDQKTLISAFAKIAFKIPNAILIIIGKGKLEKVLKQQVEQLKLTKQVLFLGVVQNAVCYFKAFDGFVLSSDFEPFGMVLLEAIVANIPIIATNAGGAKEIITDPKWRFNVGDIDHLAQLMQTMYYLTADEKARINQQNNQWLNQNFTDKAVKTQFWALPLIQSMLR